jgi:ATP-dependent RNA helicase DeaD
MTDGVWFRVNVGRERNADPKWLLPEICRQGDVTKKDVGTIKIEDTHTLVQIDARVADAFAEKVAARTKGGVRIAPNRPGEAAAPAEQGVPAPEHKPAKKPFHDKGGFKGKGGKPSKWEGGKKWGKGPDARLKKSGKPFKGQGKNKGGKPAGG